MWKSWSDTDDVLKAVPHRLFQFFFGCQGCANERGVLFICTHAQFFRHAETPRAIAGAPECEDSVLGEIVHRVTIVGSSPALKDTGFLS